MKEIARIPTTSFLPHEPAEAADTHYFDPKRTGFGTVVGGSATAVLTEVAALSRLQHPALLDSPHPIRGSSQYPLTTYRIFGYDLPISQNGEPLTQDKLVEAYMQDEEWLERHIRSRMAQGKEIVFAHHTVGTSLEPMIQSASGTRGDTLVVSRYHSRILPLDQMLDPPYFDRAYPAGAYRDELWRLQQNSLQESDFVLFPTQTERRKSIDAVSRAGILEETAAIAKFLVSPIPLKLDEFTPDPTGNKRKKAVETINQILQTTPQTDLNHIPDVVLDSDDCIFGYVGRFDFEKGIWELIDEYIDFLNDHRGQNNLPYLLAIGGLTNKPGILERHISTMEKINALPARLQKQIIMPLIPVAHQEVVHAYNLQIYNSAAEAFNISEKQARAAGIPVALTDLPAHQDTNTDLTAIQYSFGDSARIQQIFTQLHEGERFEELARAGRAHAISTFGDVQVCSNLIHTLQEKRPDFFKKDQYEGLTPGRAIPS